MAQKRIDRSRIWTFTFSVTSTGTPVTVTTHANKRFLVIGWGVTSGKSPFQFFDTAGVFQVGSIKVDAAANTTVGTAYCVEMVD